MHVRFGDSTFDDELRELVVGGTARRLSPKAFQLLAMLIEARPRPVTRQELYAALWPDVVVEQGNLHGLVAEVRSALGDDDHEIIRTIHRVGYCFAAGGASGDSPRYAILLGDEEIPLRPGPNGIGRDPRDTVVIRASAVSRHHARLVVTGDSVTIEDLGSKNGTYVGTQRVTSPLELVLGDEILVGTIRMRLIRVDELAPTATAG